MVRPHLNEKVKQVHDFKIPVLLGPGREVSTFAIIDALHATGIPVFVFDSNPSSPGFYHRGITEKFLVPDPVDEPLEFIHALCRKAVSYSGSVLMVTHDLFAEVVARHRDVLGTHYQFLIPSVETMKIANDKLETCRNALRLGFDAPQSAVLVNHKETMDFAQVCGWPVVLKRRNGSGGRDQLFLRNQKQLSRMPETVFNGDFLVQEWVPGPISNLVTAAAVLDQANLVRLLFTGRRLDILTCQGVGQGVTTYAESTHDFNLAKLAAGFLKALQFSGVCEVEYKIDERTGKAKMLEANPRFWAWVKLAIASGANFPLEYYRAALGLSPQQERFQYHAGYRYRRLMLDLLQALCRIRTKPWRLLAELWTQIWRYLWGILHASNYCLDENPFRLLTWQWIKFHLRSRASWFD